MSKQRPSRAKLIAERRQLLQDLTPLELTGLILDLDLWLEEDSDPIEVILEHEFGSATSDFDFVSERGPGNSRRTRMAFDSTVNRESNSDESPQPNVGLPVRLAVKRFLRCLVDDPHAAFANFA